MLTFIEINNFEAWEHLRLDLEQTTTIIGPSDVGKSACLRALSWCLTNTPSGTDFIRWGAETCEVVVGVDGHVVRRVRGKGINSYFLDDVEFKAFGTGVPEPIAALLCLDSGGLNWQQQADAHLWLGVSPMALLSEINRLVDLTSIDAVTSTLSTAHRQAKNELMIADDQYATAIADVRRLADAPARHAAACEMLAASDAHTAAATHLDTTKGLVADTLIASSKINAAIVEATYAKRAKVGGDNWHTRRIHAEFVRACVVAARDAAARVTSVSAPTQPDDLTAAREAYRAATTRTNTIAKSVENAQAAATLMNYKAEQIADLELELSSIKICPTCNRPI